MQGKLYAPKRKLLCDSKYTSFVDLDEKEGSQERISYAGLSSRPGWEGIMGKRNIKNTLIKATCGKGKKKKQSDERK